MDGFPPDRLAAAQQLATDRLRDLQTRLASDNDHLYQHLALYLQVLRKGLLPVVQRACFHLVTETASSTYAAMGEPERTRFQQRIRELVERCTCLLTVEQLVSLAAQRQQQQRQRVEARSREFLESLQNNETNDPAEGSPESGQEPPMRQSIDLGLNLPISADLFTQGLVGLAGMTGLAPRTPTPPEQSDPLESAALDNISAADGEGATSQPETPGESTTTPAARMGFPAMEALLTLAGESADLLNAITASDDSTVPDHTDSLLPRDPQTLLQWWQHLDQALSHRLRHLSHALNGLMVRSGLSRALLPAPLLEAVLNGQIEVLAAPPNLVRLPLPLPTPSSSERTETVMAVLLRPSDLEFESPPLRTCRQRLEHHRRRMLRMAQHHRDWQRRRQSIQTQMLWEKDINRPPIQPDANG